MNDHIEAVARAICLSNDTGPDEFDYADNEPLWRRYIPDAEAAIAAYQQSCASEAVGWFKQADVDFLIGHRGNEEIDRMSLVCALTAPDRDCVVPLFAAPPAPAGWMPIETAPKDGTWILVHTGEYTHPITVWWFKYNGRACWRAHDLEPIDDVSHWMPLPAAPEAP